MSVELVRAIEALILPPGGLLLLGLLGLLLSGRTLGKALVFIALLGTYLVSTPYVSSLLMAGLERYPALTISTARASGAQAILVLGAGRHLDAPEYGGDTLGDLHLERVRYAAWLARHTGLPVIPSGGAVSGRGTPEARLARTVLEEEFGVKVAAVEDASRTTRENARLAKGVLDRLGIDRVLLVTHAWHMPRAMDVITEAGIDAVPAPTAFRHKDDGESRISDWLPAASGMLYSRYALHEYTGRLWYRITD